MIPEIVKRAMVETVVDIGQLSKSELYELNKAVKRGWLSRGKGGPFPILKTVYAVPTFDFAASRQRYVEEATRIAEMEARLRASGYFDVRSPNYGKPLAQAGPMLVCSECGRIEPLTEQVTREVAEQDG